MSNIMMFRGGTPDFKAMFCAGEYAQFKPPFSAPHLEATPPYDSHADAAYGQGYLNLTFPLVPSLYNGNDAHHWQRTALSKLSAVGDVIFLNWVPLRSFVVAQHFEVNQFDPKLDGVYVKPVAYRVAWDFTTENWKWTAIADYDTAVTAAGVTQLPLGKLDTGDSPYAIIDLMPHGVTSEGDSATGTAIPVTFGHNIPARNAKGEPTGPLDEYYGAVVLGLKISAGSAEAIKKIATGNFALYHSAKLLAFECATQVG